MALTTKQREQNCKRANRAIGVLKQYAADTRLTGGYDRTDMVDLIADLWHLLRVGNEFRAVQTDLAIADVLRSAATHFDAERLGAY